MPATYAVRAAVALVLVCAAATNARAQDVETEQREHVVRPGDTLWDLARAYLNDPFQWRRIFEANNPGTVEDAHWIFPTERLVIPGLLQPRPQAQLLGEPFTAPVMVVEEVVPEPVDSPTVVMAVDLRRPVVPLAEYLAAPWLSMRAEGEVTGRIQRLADPAAEADQLASALHPHDRVHVAAAGAQSGDSLLVVRFGRAIGSYGRIVEPLAVLSVDSVAGGVAKASVARQFGGALVGDVVMPLPAAPEIPLGEPEPFAGGPAGRLLQFLHDEPMYGTTDVAFISLGRQDGVDIGDEFAAYVASGAAETRVATLRVVRVGDRSSTVRVMNVTSVALKSGLPIRLVAKVP